MSLQWWEDTEGTQEHFLRYLESVGKTKKTPAPPPPDPRPQQKPRFRDPGGRFKPALGARHASPASPK